MNVGVVKEAILQARGFIRGSLRNIPREKIPRVDAPLATIKGAYRTLMALNHPDHGGDIGAAAAINRAYEQALEAMRP